MSLHRLGRVFVALIVLSLTVTAASADEETLTAKATLTGFQEVTPKLTNGIGSFSATIHDASLTYTLTYGGLSSSATQAHLHFGQPAVNGGIFLWLCGSATNPGPAGTPTCPPAGGAVTRTVHASDFVTISPDQGYTAPDFPGALRILKSGDTYANVHTTRFPGGEIRGQVRTDSSD